MSGFIARSHHIRDEDVKQEKFGAQVDTKVRRVRSVKRTKRKPKLEILHFIFSETSAVRGEMPSALSMVAIEGQDGKKVFEIEFGKRRAISNCERQKPK